MDQIDLFGRPSVVDPPVNGSSVQSRETSRQGARKIAPKVYDLHERMLWQFRLKGALTDAEMAELLDVERTTVNARRSELIRLGLVDLAPKGTRKNPKSGLKNATWGLLETQG